ncbi:hypothetical protein DFH09DRAFT_1097488 [Mycena vulgaris]|nr:hypothetical protein DFH09DRAFT_1097488 [Mycena vulgaris]
MRWTVYFRRQRTDLNLRRTRDVARGGVVRYLKGSAAQTRSTFQGGWTRNGGVAFILDSDETEPSSKSAFRARNARFVCGIASGTKRQFRSSAANRSLTALGSKIPDKIEAPIKVPGTCVTLPPARLPHLRAPPKFECAPFWGVRITRGLERGTPDQILRDFASAVGVIDGAGGGERGPDVQKGVARDGLRKRISGCLRAIDTLQVGSQSNSPTEASSIFIPLLVPSLLIPAHDPLPRTTFTFRGFGFSRWLACPPSLFGIPGSIPPEFGLLCLPRHAYPPPKHFGAGFGGPANGPTTPPPSPDSTYRRHASGASVTNTRIPWSADSSFPSVSDGAGPIFDSIIISTATPSIPQHLQFDFGRLASEDHPAALRHNTLPSRERAISRLSEPLRSGQSSLRGPGFSALRGAQSCLRILLGCEAVTHQGSTRHIVFPRALHLKPRPPTPSELCIRFVNAPRASNSRSRRPPKSPPNPDTTYRRAPKFPPSPPFKIAKISAARYPHQFPPSASSQLATRSVESPRARHLPPQERIESRPSNLRRAATNSRDDVSMSRKRPFQPLQIAKISAARYPHQFPPSAQLSTRDTKCRTPASTLFTTPGAHRIPPLALFKSSKCRCAGSSLVVQADAVEPCDQRDPEDLRADC